MYALEVIIAMNRKPSPRTCAACGQRVETPARPPAPVKSEPAHKGKGQR
jgi:hypothetical protein